MALKARGPLIMEHRVYYTNVNKLRIILITALILVVDSKTCVWKLTNKSPEQRRQNVFWLFCKNSVTCTNVHIRGFERTPTICCFLCVILAIVLTLCYTSWSTTADSECASNTAIVWQTWKQACNCGVWVRPQVCKARAIWRMKCTVTELGVG